MFYRTGYSGYYRDPRVRPNPDPYSQDWAQMYGYPEPVNQGNPYVLVSGKRKSRPHPVHTLPARGDPTSPIYIRTSQPQPPRKVVPPRIPSGYEFYPSEYYSQYASAFYPEIQSSFFHHHQPRNNSQGWVHLFFFLWFVIFFIWFNWF